MTDNQSPFKPSDFARIEQTRHGLAVAFYDHIMEDDASGPVLRVRVDMEACVGEITHGPYSDTDEGTEAARNAVRDLDLHKAAEAVASTFENLLTSTPEEPQN